MFFSDPCQSPVKPLPKQSGIPSPIENGDYADGIGSFAEIDTVGSKSPKPGLTHARCYRTELFRMQRNTLQQFVYLFSELLPKTGLLSLVPGNSLHELTAGDGSEPNCSAHFQPNRCRTSARTSSQERPPSGFFRNSSARRSSSASISGLSTNASSPSSAQICSAIRLCSSRGSVRTRSITSAALISVK
jgi:hypothetical protein